MKKVFLLLGSLFLFLSLTVPAEARMGKVFFDNGRWMKGDLQIRTAEDGRQVIVISLKSGSVTVPRSDVRTIIYADGGAVRQPANHEVVFMSALKNTSSRPSPKKYSVPTAYDEVIRQASNKHNLDPDLVKAVIKQESNFNWRDVSHKGAAGLMQLMPATARGLGVRNIYDPSENIHGGTQYLRYMLEHFNGDVSLALAAYNAGPGAVRKYGAIPPYRETQDYVRKVLQYYRAYRGNPKLYAFEDTSGKLVISDRPYVP